MKLIIFAFVIIYISAVSTFEVKKIEGVEGDDLEVLFDSKFNSYVYSTNPKNPYDSKFYKLDPENNVVFVKDVINGDCSLMLNDKDELYTICVAFDGSFAANISIIRVDTSELEYITTVREYLSITEDDTGNLIYSGNEGLFFLKYNTTEAVIVKNLENLVRLYDDAISTDKNGNTYVQGFTWGTEIGEIAEYQFAVVLGDSKEGIPEGYIIEGLLDYPDTDYVESMSINSNNELLIVVTDGMRIGTSSVKKISNGTITTIYANEGYDRYSVSFNEKRTLIVADDVLHGKSRVTSLSPDGEIVEILNSKNETWSSEGKGVSIDEDGNAFIEWPSVEEERSHLEFLNYTDTMTVDVDLGDIKYIYYTLFDGLNNLWIVTDRDVYFVEKGSLEVQIVPNSSNLLDMWINTKKKAS